jgi:hypothetical protein
MKKNRKQTPDSEAILPSQDGLAYEQEVSLRAYEIWEESGHQHGQDKAHWLQAESEVQMRRRS